jgi:hypothetical protein
VSGGYSFTTINSAPHKPTTIGVSFHLDDSAWVRACGLDSGRPQLSISHGEVSARFAPVPDTITQTDVRIAHQLADQAALYATAVERLLAEQDTPKATGTAA